MAMHQLLPVEIATRDRVGTVKGGKNVIIDEDGTMSVDVADVGGDLAEIKRLLGMSGSGEAPDRNGGSAWSRIMYLLGLGIGEKSDEASKTDNASLWARVKYLLDCCQKVQEKLDNLPTGPGESDLTELKTRVTNLENKVSELETNLNNHIAKFDQYMEKTDGTLRDIIAKFYGGGTIGPEGIVSWGVNGKAAVGTMNVYAGDMDKHGKYKNYIMTRNDDNVKNNDNDVKVV